MKKLILAAGALVAMIGAASCGSSDSASSFEDSLSIALGEQNGAIMNQNFQTVPAEELYHFKKADFIRGLKEVIMADTAARAYYAGLSVGMQLNGQLAGMEEAGIKIDRNRFLSAFSKAFMADTTGDMNNIQLETQRLMGRAQEIVMEKRAKDQEAAKAANEAEAQKNRKAGDAYVAEQMKSDNTIKKTESGLAYKVVKQGTGKPVAADGKVKVKYTGRLIDGKEFDSSNGEAVTFVPDQTVAGFSEALQMMAPGSEYVIYLPADLAYGDRATGQIPAGSTLVFDVEVVEVE